MPKDVSTSILTLLQLGTAGGYAGMTADAGGSGLTANISPGTSFQIDGSKPSWRVLNFYSGGSNDFWKVQRAASTGGTNITVTWVDFLTVASDGQITLSKPINRRGTFAARPATAPDGTKYFASDLIFAAGGGGFTFPASGGLAFGPTDGDTYLSDGTGWTRTVKGSVNA